MQDDNATPNNEHEFMEVEAVPKKTRALAMLEDDLSWTRDLGVLEIDGIKVLLGPSGTPVIVESTLTEDQFVTQWLDQFSLGYIGEKAYIDLQQWAKLSADHLRGVMITDNNNKPLFVIPPLIKPVLSPEEQLILDQAHLHFTNAASAQQHGDESRAKDLIDKTSEALGQLIGDKHAKISEFVPDWFYKKYDVNPYVRQSMIYCRDVYRLNPANKEDWLMAESIFTAISKQQRITDEQKLFMSILSEDEFVFPEYDVVEDSSVKAIAAPNTDDQEDFDPFES